MEQLIYRLENIGYTRNEAETLYELYKSKQTIADLESYVIEKEGLQLII